VTANRKKKLTPCRRSYDKPTPENKHLHLKPFRSDPTGSSSCAGHLALANKLSHVYKPRHDPDSSVTHKGQGSTDSSEHKDGDNEPVKPHQRLGRTLAVTGDPPAAILAPTRGEYCRDMGGASNEPSVDVSPCSKDKNSRTDTATQLDTEGSLLCPVNQAKQELPQRALFNDTQQFFAARSNSQDYLTGRRFSSPMLGLAPTTTRMDNMYIVGPLVLHPHRQFPITPLMQQIRMSPSCPQMFIYQPRSYLPQNEQIKPSVVASSHPFFP